MAELNVLDIDDAIMQGGAQADQWLEECKQAYEKPAREAQAAAMWYQMLGKMLPGMPPQMAEQQMRQMDGKRYDEAKRRFMEGMSNGAKR